MDSSIPSNRKCFRPAETVIGSSSEIESQSLIPDSQRRCSVIAPILWMWMNVFLSMTKSIPGFCLNLNSQFIYDKCPSNGHPGEPFVQINGGLPDYKLSLRDVVFIIAPATTKVSENILILIPVIAFTTRFNKTPLHSPLTVQIIKRRQEFQKR